MLDRVAVGEVREDVACHPVEFVRDDPEVGRPWRDGYIADLLHRLDEDHVVDDRADAADTFRKEHHLLPGAAAHDPLDPLLHVTELDLGAEHPLARRLALDADGLLPAGMHRAERDGYVDSLLHGCFSS